ncbi:MAG: hypothetical protein JO085_05325 [Acidimicrobiia bacterium]|nr:hypothetical protein [Acidimicrobiia bacterium]
MPAHSARRRAGQLVAVTVAATTVVGLQALHGVAHADPVNPVTGCSEDSFLGGAASPDPGSVVTVPLGSSQAFSVVYHDEKPINTSPGFAAQYSVTDSGGHVVQSGAPASSPASAPSGTHDQFNTLLSVNFGPSAPGTYTLKIKAWDGDQNKAGGDCGQASWQLTTPNPPPPPPPPPGPTTTTVPPATTTTIPATTTTTQPSTPQTNVLGETFTQAPPAAAVTATPALTG